MTRTTSGLLAASLLTAIGASVLMSYSALSGSPFGGSDIGGGSGVTYCGPGLDCTSDTFTAADTTGPGFACNSALASCFDPGPGACNSFGTNGSGDIVLGGTACAPVIRIGGSGNVTITGTGGITIANTGLDMNNNGLITNTAAGKPVLVNDGDGLRLTGYSATPTCASGVTGTLSVDSDDGRAYYCDGTTAQIVAFRGGPWSGSLNFNAFSGQGCQTLAFTATGATANEPIVGGGCGTVMTTDTQLMCSIAITGANTASVRLCCMNTLGCADLSAITFTATALR